MTDTGRRKKTIVIRTRARPQSVRLSLAQQSTRSQHSSGATLTPPSRERHCLAFAVSRSLTLARLAIVSQHRQRTRRIHQQQLIRFSRPQLSRDVCCRLSTANVSCAILFQMHFMGRDCFPGRDSLVNRKGMVRDDGRDQRAIPGATTSHTWPLAIGSLAVGAKGRGGGGGRQRARQRGRGIGTGG